MKIKRAYKIDTLIPDLNWHDLTDKEIEKYCKTILNINRIRNIQKSTRLGFEEPVCYDYAFDKMNDTDFFACFSVVDYLENNYIQINISQAKNGDIVTYDSEDERWLKYFRDGPGFLNDLELLEPGRGYWFYVEQDWTINY